MIQLSVSIMHCPMTKERRDGVERIIEKLKPINIQSLLEDFNIVQDWKQRGAWATDRTCWITGLLTKSTHHLVLQDDVILCDDFLKSTLKCIQVYPKSPIGLYVNRKIAEEARSKDYRWVQIPDGVWGQAIILPNFLISRFLDWEKKHILPHFKHDDSRLAMFLVDQKIPAMCPMPSLVNHDGAERSIVGQSNKNKIARWYIANKSYLDYNWADNKFLKGSSALSKDYYKYYV